MTLLSVVHLEATVDDTLAQIGQVAKRTSVRKLKHKQQLIFLFAAAYSRRLKLRVLL